MKFDINNFRLVEVLEYLKKAKPSTIVNCMCNGKRIAFTWVKYIATINYMEEGLIPVIIEDCKAYIFCDSIEFIEN